MRKAFAVCYVDVLARGPLCDCDMEPGDRVWFYLDGSTGDDEERRGGKMYFTHPTQPGLTAGDVYNNAADVVETQRMVWKVSCSAPVLVLDYVEAPKRPARRLQRRSRASWCAAWK